MYRIVSLLPSATEVIHSLGMLSYLVGRSHECDFPSAVESLPICTAPKFSPVGNSQEIHDRVTAVLEQALSVYEVRLAVLQELQPTHIITQAQCEVCAVSLTDVEQAVAQLTGCEPQIISLQPNLLHEVWLDIERVGRALDVDYLPVVQQLKDRVERCRVLTQQMANHPRVACIEWIEPLMSAGNWIPELVELAGGINLFGQAGKHSPWLAWSDLCSADPDLLIFMPCGFDLARTEMEVRIALQDSKWQSLSAVRRGAVYVTDGNSYFNRPGPRLVDSLEILQDILHPELKYEGYVGKAWKQLDRNYP